MADTDTAPALADTDPLIGAMFADELTMGTVVEVPCTGRVPVRAAHDDSRTGLVVCDAVTDPHEVGPRHWATIVRLRRSPAGGVVYAIVRRWDGEELPWRAQAVEAVRVLVRTP